MRRAKEEGADAMRLGGWLFADLLLALAVIFLASGQGSAKPGQALRVTLSLASTPASTPTPTPMPPTSTSAPNPTPTPTATAAVFVIVETAAPQASISHQPVELVIQTRADALLAGQADELARVKAAIQAAAREAGLERRAGIVLTFGTSPSPGEGSQLAARVNQVLPEALPAVFEGAAVRTFHQINQDPGKRGEVLLEVYILLSP
jgi:hypothetical protein